MAQRKRWYLKVEKIFKAADTIDQAAFFIVVGAVLCVGTCWALTKILVDKVAIKPDNRAKKHRIML